MRRMSFRQIIIILITLLLCIHLFASCSKKESEQSNEKSEETEKKEPETLKKLESTIQEIIDELDKKEEEEKQETEMKIETTTEMKSEQDSEKEQNETKQETKQEITKESPEDKKWKAVSKRIEEIHKQWNNLQPDLVTAGVSKQPLDDFSNTLNSLTIFADSKDMQSTLFLSNELTRIIADFMEQFKGKVPPDIKRMSYYVRDAKYNGMINQWEKAKSGINNLKSHWSIIKPQTNKDQESDASKTEFSITELEKVIDQKNLNLTKIKSDITLENIKKLEESFEKAEKKE